MCGIAGVVNLNGSPATLDAVRRMTDPLRHRGPDDEGLWVEGPIGLGSRRLAIIDLSPRARQPIANEDGSVCMVFNGEIYNFQSLREQLQQRGHRFRSDSDGEVIVHLYEDEGVQCLDRLRGMFAFALWDASRRRLFAARDRLGKKPFFYRHTADAFLFGSEAKAVLADPRVQASPDAVALHHYLTYGCVPSPLSAFRGLRKLPPAHYLVLERGGDLRVERYWTLQYGPKRSEPTEALAEELSALLEEAVRLRMVSDVPLGALLSGGLDSSTVVALMRRVTSGRLATFSIGFDEAEYNELEYARQVAQHLGTEHHERVVKPVATEMLPRLVWHYDEPFADSSALPTFALSAMAREVVTVALTGDGGDESFLGYDRYVAMRLGGWQDHLPEWMRRGVRRAALSLPATGPKSAPVRVRRFFEAAALSPPRRYARWMTLFDPAASTALYAPEFADEVTHVDPLALIADGWGADGASDPAEAAAHADVRLYLPDDLLVKMDIASMAHSLEARSPLLDHRVVEFAARLPVSLKLHRLTQKYLVKRLMTHALPPAVLRRRKMGFGVPIDRWLRHDLRDMVGDLLLDARSRQRGYFRPATVARLVDEHARGRTDHHARLWSLLMLEMWHRLFIDRDSGTAAHD